MAAVHVRRGVIKLGGVDLGVWTWGHTNLTFGFGFEFLICYTVKHLYQISLPGLFHSCVCYLHCFWKLWPFCKFAENLEIVPLPKQLSFNWLKTLWGQVKMWSTIHKDLEKENRVRENQTAPTPHLPGILGRHYRLYFWNGWSSVSCIKGDKKESIKAPFLNI